MPQIYLEMLELSKDPNLSLYIAVCAGISATLFLSAFFLAIRAQLRSASHKLAGGEISHNSQHAPQFNNLEESAAT